jgi:plastocyanin
MNARRWLILALLTMAISAPLALLRAQPAPAPAGPKKHAVSIKEMKFAPDSLEIKAGDTVVWTNNDDRDHILVEAANAFKSDNIKPGKTFSYKFDKAGKFSYSCTYHPREKGTITVTEDKDPKPKPPPAG